MSPQASNVLVTPSTFSNSASKIGQVLLACAVFFAVLLIVFFAAGRATGSWSAGPGTRDGDEIGCRSGPRGSTGVGSRAPAGPRHVRRGGGILLERR